MKPEPPNPLYAQRRYITRKERLQDSANDLASAINGMKLAGYMGTDTALELAEKALRQLTEDIQVTDD